MGVFYPTPSPAEIRYGPKRRRTPRRRSRPGNPRSPAPPADPGVSDTGPGRTSARFPCLTDSFLGGPIPASSDRTLTPRSGSCFYDPFYKAKNAAGRGRRRVQGSHRAREGWSAPELPRTPTAGPAPATATAAFTFECGLGPLTRGQLQVLGYSRGAHRSLGSGDASQL